MGGGRLGHFLGLLRSSCQEPKNSPPAMRSGKHSVSQKKGWLRSTPRLISIASPTAAKTSNTPARRNRHQHTIQPATAITPDTLSKISCVRTSSEPSVRPGDCRDKVAPIPLLRGTISPRYPITRAAPLIPTARLCISMATTRAIPKLFRLLELEFSPLLGGLSIAAWLGVSYLSTFTHNRSPSVMNSMVPSWSVR